ncbi:MAG TPA: S41 family peptidase [Acidimicrobiia bacterium]
MSTQKIIPALIAIALLLGACTASGDADTSTSVAGVETTTTAATGDTTSSTDSIPESTTAPNRRPLELVDCDDPEDDVVIVCEAYDLINEQYVDPVDDDALADAAALALATLDGNDSDDLLVCATPSEVFVSMCNTAADAADDTTEAAEVIVAGFATYALDPNSAYLDANALDLLQEEQQGQIEGIGALVSPEDETIPGDDKQCGVVSETCQILIVSTISGAPAEDAGLERNDVLVAVDGEPILGWTVDEVTAAVRGPAGSEVTLSLERGGEPFDVTITRAAVVIPVVEAETIDNVGYVRLTSFTGTASSQFETAVVDRLADGVDELVIDLRNNPGGFLTTAIDVTSIFLDDGDVVTTEGPDDSTTYPVNGDAIVPDDMTVYLVVNKGSASASEVLAATLQERDAAVVVGENTFGKNTVQQRFNLSNGGALKLTIARWLTPGGHDFGGGGVTPDVSLDVTDLTAEELVAAVTGTG